MLPWRLIRSVAPAEGRPLRSKGKPQVRHPGLSSGKRGGVLQLPSLDHTFPEMAYYGGHFTDDQGYGGVTYLVRRRGPMVAQTCRSGGERMPHGC
jgi:hypothetical protein